MITYTVLLINLIFLGKSGIIIGTNYSLPSSHGGCNGAPVFCRNLIRGEMLQKEKTADYRDGFYLWRTAPFYF